MEIIDKYAEIPGASDEELKNIIDSMTEKEAKEILYYIMSNYNKIRDAVIKFIPEA